jgi:hypothetical protein
MSEAPALSRTELRATVEHDLLGLSSGSSFTTLKVELPRVLPGILPLLRPGDRRIWLLMTKNATDASLTIRSLGGRKALIILVFISNNADTLDGLMGLGELI